MWKIVESLIIITIKEWVISDRKKKTDTVKF